MITPGQVLKKKRLELKKSIKVVSQETKIQQRFLNYIENDEFSKFDSPVFASGFVKLYAQHLGLDDKKVVALFRREVDNANPNQKEKKKRFNISKYLTGKNLGILALLISVIVFIIYLNLQFYNYRKPPILEITNPTNNTTVEKNIITIQGKTEEETTISINNENIEIKDNLTFEKEITLIQGINTISITATNKINNEKKITETLTITYIPEVVEEPEEVIEARDILVKIVTEDLAWIQLNIDGEQKIAYIIEAGETDEYIATDSIEIISGRPTITKLFIDGQEYSLSTNTETGVASLVCNITSSGKINCSN